MKKLRTAELQLSMANSEIMKGKFKNGETGVPGLNTKQLTRITVPK